MSRIVLLALSYVDEALSKPVAVVGVVAAAAPHPVVVVASSLLAHRAGDGDRLRTATAAARRQLGIAACPTDGVHDSCRRHRVHQSSLTASCADLAPNSVSLKRTAMATILQYYRLYASASLDWVDSVEE